MCQKQNEFNKIVFEYGILYKINIMFKKCQFGNNYVLYIFSDFKLVMNLLRNFWIR